MIRFGASMLSWISQWTPENGRYAIQRAADCGFDLLEISLPATLELDVNTVKADLLAHKLEATYSLILPADHHLPTYPDKALGLICNAVDLVQDMGGDYLGGVLYSAIGCFSGLPRNSAEMELMREVLKSAGDYAFNRGVTIGIEPINRYETYLLTSAREVMELISEIDSPALGLMLDTFHMNIEENGFYDPIIAAGGQLKYVHMTESDRGMLGEGNVQWDDFFKALAKINYSGDLVLENFSSAVPGMSALTSLWRTSKYDAESLALGSLQFMKNKVETYFSQINSTNYL